MSWAAPFSTNPGDIALNADQMTVNGDLFCQQGFQAEGEIRLMGAHIGGQLSLSSATLANPGKPALSADQMTVDGRVLRWGTSRPKARSGS